MEDEEKVDEDKKEMANFLEGLAKHMEDNKHIKVNEQIKCPIEIDKLNIGRERKGFQTAKVGTMVKIRPCGEKYEDKTFLGIYLGDMQISVNVFYDSHEKSLTFAPHNNPAIYVPDLEEVIWGCGSWWSPIESEEQLGKDISDEDIQNVWYVKALKQISEIEKNKK